VPALARGSIIIGTLKKKKKNNNIFFILLLFKNHRTIRQHNYYYKIFLHFILFWAFPPSAFMIKQFTESSVLKWDKLRRKYLKYRCKWPLCITITWFCKAVLKILMWMVFTFLTVQICF
jgi:hypothetical protein